MIHALIVKAWNVWSVTSPKDQGVRRASRRFVPGMSGAGLEVRLAPSGMMSGVITVTPSNDDANPGPITPAPNTGGPVVSPPVVSGDFPTPPSPIMMA